MVTPARIKSAREDLKLTKRELAKRIGVHESSINKYEKGLVDIPLSKIYFLTLPPYLISQLV